jgi:hypothetical protein
LLESEHRNGFRTKARRLRRRRKSKAAPDSGAKPFILRGGGAQAPGPSGRPAKLAERKKGDAGCGIALFASVFRFSTPGRRERPENPA